MAVNIDIYSETEESTKRVTFDVSGNVLAPSSPTVTSTTEVEYYFVLTTTARDSSNLSIPAKVVENLIVDPDGGAAVYSTITDMVDAYTKWFSEQIDFSR